MRGTTGWDDPAQVVFEKFPELVKTAPSVEELAVTLGVPPSVLKTTVDRYNSMVEKGKDEDFGRFDSARLPSEEILLNPHDPQKIERPPFYGLRTFPVTRKSMGGVMIDVSGRGGSVNKCVNRHQAAFSWVTGLTGTPLTYWAPW